MPTTGQAQQVASSVSRQYVNPAAETEGQTETQVGCLPNRWGWYRCMLGWWI